MNRHIITAISLLLFSSVTAAPTLRTIKGRVLDATTQTPLSGVLVRVAEVEGYSVLTGDDGTYELKAPDFATSLAISAPDCNLTKIGLTRDEQQRDALVYPVTFSADYQQFTNVTGTEQAADFRFSPAISIEEEIQKRLGADVHTTSRSGIPGLGSVMFMGGLNSLNANAQPLIVIDGVVFDQFCRRDTYSNASK